MKVLDGKVLGVIGGMGPVATNTFYNMVIDKTEANCDQEHINMIILNHATMPDRTAAIKSGDYEEILGKMVRDAQFLEDAGVECIVIPCNTAHFMLAEVQSKIKTEIIDMIEEAAKAVEKALGSTSAKVGIMATTGTIEMGLYQKKFKSMGMETSVPSEKNQIKLMEIIYKGIKEAKGVNRQDFDDVVSELRSSGCDKILLACTELSVYGKEVKLDDYFLDAMEALSQKAVEICKPKNKKEEENE